MISPERLDLMQRGWQRLVAPFGGDPATVYAPFDALVTAYQEPHRQYHTLEHVAEVLRVVPRLLPTDIDSRPVLLAAWFHDAVYNPRAADNEARSADLAEKLLPGVGVPTDVAGEVRRLVMATAHAGVAPPDPAAVALIDSDLAILGASPVRYRRYAAAIRAEYAHVPDADYRVGRARVLQRFLDRPAIYRHPLMRAEGEAAARANMAAELAGL